MAGRCSRIIFVQTAIAALILTALYSAPASSQDDLFGDPEGFRNLQNWSELCEVVDCDQFPIGYNTYVFGPEVYYFPTWTTMTVRPPSVSVGGVEPGRLKEVDANGDTLRSLRASGIASVYGCCHFLLTFYGLAEAMPVFQESPSGNRMPAARMTLSSFDRPDRYNNIQRWLGDDLGAFPSVDEVLPNDAVSYNDDFWVLGSGELEGRRFRPFRLLSKRPLLHGRHVYVACGDHCTFGTMSFAGSEAETRPHIQLVSMLLTRQNMFLCSPSELQNGCNPALEIFDQVPVMLGLVEDMLAAATVFPEGRNNE